MRIKFGVISSDSHGQLHKDAFTNRMSKTKFGDRIPQLVETTDKANMSDPMDRRSNARDLSAALGGGTEGCVRSGGAPEGAGD